MKTYTCKHYTGGIDKDRCRADVCYREVTTDPDAGGCAFRSPCILWDKRPGPPLSERQRAEFARRGTCPKFELPTAEEVAASDRETAETAARIVRLIPLMNRIKAEHANSWTGIVPCPICGANLTLRLNVFNSPGREGRSKHLHGHCLTPGCVSWME